MRKLESVWIDAHSLERQLFLRACDVYSDRVLVGVREGIESGYKFWTLAASPIAHRTHRFIYARDA